jgi:REP element-mobilizing transposase RayT
MWSGEVVTLGDFCRREKGLMIFAFVIKSNHVHLTVQAREDTWQYLSCILGDFKKYTSKKIIKAIDSGLESHQEWLSDMFRYYAKYNMNKWLASSATFT